MLPAATAFAREGDRLQPGEPVAAAGAAEEDCVTSERKGTPRGVSEMPETQRA